jgi:hypothetical protein
LIYEHCNKALCDCGGSNNARYTSKYNPIEHRLFPHITRACKGVVFKSVELVNDLIAQAKTSTGLKVFSNILTKTFNIGRKVADDFKENMVIQFDDYLPQWSYLAVPQTIQT